MRIRGFALDIGNDANKGKGGFFGADTYYVPNVIKRFSEDDDLATREIPSEDKRKLENTLRVEIESPALEQHGGRGMFLVGQAALSFADADQTALGDEKSDSDQGIISGLAILAADAVKYFKPSDDGNIYASYILSLGLPMEEAVSKAKVEKFIRKMKQIHTVTFLNTPQFNGQKVIIHIKHVVITPEGMAPFLFVASDSRGTLIDDFKKHTILLYDLGGGTGDGGLYRRGEPVPRGAQGLDIGCNGIIDDMRAEVARKYGNVFHSRNQFVTDLILTEDEEQRFKLEPRKKGFKAPVSIEPIVSSHKDKLAGQIFNLVFDPYYREFSDLRAIIMIGGGAVFMKDALKKRNGGGLEYKAENGILSTEFEGKYRLFFLPEKDSIWGTVTAYHRRLRSAAKALGIDMEDWEPVIQLV